MRVVRIVNQVAAAGTVWALTSGVVLAQSISDGFERHRWWLDGRRLRYRQVPEIDASAGFLAIAAVLATLALAYELRRRRVGERG